METNPNNEIKPETANGVPLEQIVYLDEAPIVESKPIVPDGEVEMTDGYGHHQPVEKPDADAPEAVFEEPKVEKKERTPLPPAENIVQHYPVSRELTEEWDNDAISLGLPGETVERLREAMENMPNVKADDTDKKREWSGINRAGFEVLPADEAFQNTVTRPGSQFQQTVPSDAGPMAAAKPQFRDNESVTMTGERAVLRFAAYIGQGGLLQIPLWHSGFWVTLKTPTERRVLDLERRIMNEKVLLGRMTNGAVLGNTSVFIASHLMHFVMEHLYDTSLKEREKIGQLIQVHDIQHLAWGMACAIWPDGFQYARAVLGKTDDENTIIRAMLNLGKLQFTDIREMTPWQRAHMTNRQGSSMTTASVERYQNEFSIGSLREVDLGGGVKVTLKVPTLDEYLDSGQKWVNDIVVTVDRLFGMDDDLEARNEYIMNQGRATNMRQFSHWVKSIKYGESQQIGDIETLEASLDMLSADEKRFGIYKKAITKYMGDSTMSVIAVPTVTAEEENKYPKFPHLIPIDALTTFFTLLIQKVRKIRAR